MSNELDVKIKNDIKRRLNPKPLDIILKVSIIHLLSAVFTLAICPQFGKKLFAFDINLMDYFMMITGPRYCVALCGTFFIGTSFFINSLFLNYDEFRVIRTHRHLTVFMIVLISFGSFIMFDPVLFLESTVLWFIGAVAGGYITLEVSEILKRKIAVFN